MADQQDILVQKITVIRQSAPPEDLDRSFLKNLTYIETPDLSGPRLIFAMDDHYRIIRDELGVKEGEVLEVVLADRFQQDGIDKTVRFVILTMPIKDSLITFNCMELTVYTLKVPAKAATLFVQKSPSAIIQKLIPGVKVDAGSFPAVNDYHLLPGMRPTRLLRQMAQEYGAVCFWQRGRIVFKKLAELYAQPPALQYSHNDASKVNKILTYKKPNTGVIIGDLVNRNYVGWDMVEGFVKSGKLPKAPPEFASVPRTSLDNLSVIAKPAIEFVTAGNGGLYPGIVMGLAWNTDRADLPIDESLPVKAVVGLVAHDWTPQAYFCHVSGGRP